MDNNLPNQNSASATQSPATAPSISQVTPPAPVEPVSIPPTPAPVKKSKKNLIIMVVIILLVLIGAGILAWMYIGKSEQKFLEDDRLKSEESQDPFKEFEAALDKTLEARSVYLDFKSTITSKITSSELGLTETSVNHLDGFLSGMDEEDGETGNSKMQMQIYSDEDPSLSVVVDVISLSNGITYIKGPATSGKWLLQTEEDMEKDLDDTPTDASLFGFDLLFWAFSEDKLLFKEIDKDTFRRLQDETSEGRTLERYEVEIDIPAYITAFEAEEDSKVNEVSDAKEILKNATLKTTFYVDNATGYIVKLVMDAKNLSQIQTAESQEYGIITNHDTIVTAELSRFNLDVDVTPPTSVDILNPQLQTFNTQNPLTSDVLGLNNYRFDK